MSTGNVSDYSSPKAKETPSNAQDKNNSPAKQVDFAQSNSAGSCPVKTWKKGQKKLAQTCSIQNADIITKALILKGVSFNTRQANQVWKPKTKESHLKLPEKYPEDQMKATPPAIAISEPLPPFLAFSFSRL